MNIFSHLRRYWLGYSFAVIAWFFFFLHLVWDFQIYGPGLMDHILGGQDYPHHIPLFLMPILGTAIGYLLEKRRSLAEVKGHLEEKYSALVENTTDGIAIIQDGVLKFVNVASMELIGYSSEELVGKDFLETIVPEEREKIKKRYSERMAGKEVPSIYEVTLLRRDGATVPVELNASVIDYEGRPADLVFLRDITERRKAEEALRESEERLKTLIDSMQAGVVIIDAETHEITDVNPVAAEMIGAPKEEIIGSVCHKYICPAEGGKCPITDLGHKIDSSERVLINAEGESVPILKTVVPITLKGRSYLVESFLDLADRKRSEQDLQKAKDELERRVEERTSELKESRDALLNLMEDLEESHRRLEVAYEELKEVEQMKSDLIANVSHELKTPLTIALSAIELSRDEGVEGERGTMLKMCEDAILREERIVGDLLELASFERERLKLKKEPVDLADLISECEAEMGPSILTKGIKLATSVARGMPPVIGDRVKIKHALTNLLDNALKFNQEGGRIEIDVRRKQDYAEVTVADTGVGIPKDQLDKVFDRFYQVDTSSKRRYGGSGIGLAIVKEVIESHKGTIKAESERGKGTRFVLTLPLEKPAKRKK